MNERIKELMIKAGYAAPELAPRAQRFAELVKLECIGVIAEAVERREPASTYVTKLKEYFK